MFNMIGPHSPRRSKSAISLVPAASDVRTVQYHWSPQPQTFEMCKNNCPHSPRPSKSAISLVPHVRNEQCHWSPMFEMCNIIGPRCSKCAISLVSHVRNVQYHLSPHVRNAQMSLVLDVRNVQYHWSPTFEMCNISGPRCSKCAISLVTDVRNKSAIGFTYHW